MKDTPEKIVPGKSHKFLTLDASRGVAAITVMAYHYLGEKTVVAHGYLAVDFFFMLSGFVLTFAYQTKLDQGWSTGSFFKMRLVRLYPLYFLGLILGSLLFIVGSHLGITKRNDPLSIILLFFILGSLLLPIPSFFTTAGSAQFPFNYPSWSLFYELAANLFHAFLLRRKTWTFLCGTLLISGAGLFYSVSQFGTVDFGARQSQFFPGFLRVLFSYTGGILLFRIWQKGSIRLSLNPYMGIALLLIFLAAPIGINHIAFYELTAICLLFPVLILLLASTHPNPILVRPFQLLGTTSYSIYVLHLPMGTLLSAIWKRIPGLRILDFETPGVKIVFMVVVIAVAFIVDRIYDLPARNFLRDQFMTRSSHSKRDIRES